MQLIRITTGLDAKLTERGLTVSDFLDGYEVEVIAAPGNLGYIGYKKVTFVYQEYKDTHYKKRVFAGGRNTWLIQMLSPLIYKYDADDILVVFKKGYQHNPLHNKTLTTGIRDVKALGITIINGEQFETVKPYKDLAEFIKLKQGDNAQNIKRLRYVDLDGSCMVSGLITGATLTSSHTSLLVLSKILGDTHTLWVDVSQSTTADQAKIAKLLTELENIKFVGDGSSMIRSYQKTLKIRNQSKFKSNIIGTIGAVGCLFCGVDEDDLLISAHLHRVTDIKNTPIELEAKRKLAVDGYNGIQLCPLHDKLYEDGILYINDDFSVGGNIDKYWVDGSKPVKYLEDGHREYLAKHRERVL